MGGSSVGSLVKTVTLRPPMVLNVSSETESGGSWVLGVSDGGVEVSAAAG